MRHIIAFFIKNRVFADLLSVFIILVGLIAAFNIRREVFPNVSFDIITVTTIYPGSSPEEVEELISSPIEQDLQEVDGIKRLQSFSGEGRSYIVMILDPDQTTEDQAKSDVKDVIDTFEVPEGSEDPIVVALQSKQQPILEIHITSEKLDDMQLRQVAKDLEKDLERLSGVAKVVHRGLRNLEVRVEPDPDKLLRQGVTLDEVVQALRLQNKSIPAGTLEQDPNINPAEKIVRTIGTFESLDEIRDTVVRANELGQPLRVRDLASVSYGLERPSVLNRTNGKPALSLTVLKKEKADAIEMVDNVRRVTEEFSSRVEGGLNTSFINDFSTFIRRRVSILTTNLFFGLLLVGLVLALFMPIRVAAIVTMGIVLSFFATIALFEFNDYSINLISLLGLIIVCGMLVDDAVVVSDNIVRHIEKGAPPEEAAIRGTSEIWSAVTASVLTTITAFLPMMFMSGIFGKFVKQIPLGVIIALIFSLAEALLILPQHMASFVKPSSLRMQRNYSKWNLRLRFQAFWDEKVVPSYLKIVALFLRRRYIVSGVTGLIFVFSLFLAATQMRFILFPPDGIEAFFIRVKGPTGNSLSQTVDTVKPIEQAVARLGKNELLDFTTSVGLVQQDPNDPNTKRGSEYAQIAVYLTPDNERERTALDIIEALKKEVGKPEGVETISFERVNTGPPVGKPISVGVRGKDYSEIMKAVAEMKPMIKELPGVLELEDSYVPGKEEIQIVINRPEASAAGLSVAQIGTTVRTAFDGAVATTINELEDEVDVRVSFPYENRASFETLQKIRIPNATGNLIPLLRVAHIEKGQGIASYSHEANQREVKITGEVDTDVTSAATITNQIQEKVIPEISKRYPRLNFGFGGEDEDTQESLQSLMRAFMVAFMGIFLILVLTFKNIYQPFLILLTIPLGIMSVIWTLIVMNMPLSFMAALGVVALAGVIVNNAIVLIDFVNSARAEGMDKTESILQAASLRIRPIFLTSSTTVAGLLPTAHGIGGLDKFVVPIAMALGYGILFGSILTAFVFPSAIAVLDDIRDLLSRVHARFFGAKAGPI